MHISCHTTSASPRYKDCMQRALGQSRVYMLIVDQHIYMSTMRLTRLLSQCGCLGFPGLCTTSAADVQKPILFATCLWSVTTVNIH